MALTKRQMIDLAESSLVNDEASSDQEMKLFFLENGFQIETADKIVEQRNAALLDGIDFKLNIRGLDFSIRDFKTI